MLSIILRHVTVFTRMFETARRFVLWALKERFRQFTNFRLISLN